MIGTELRRVFELLSADLTPNRVRLEVQEKKIGGEAVKLSLSLTPTNPNAATILAHVNEQSGVDLIVGRGAVFEVPLKGGRYVGLACIDEVRTICTAVIRGDFEEEVWFKGRRVVKAAGRIQVGDKSIGSYWRQVFSNPLVRARREHYRYSPY